MGGNPTNRRSRIGRRGFLALTGTAVGTTVSGVGTLSDPVEASTSGVDALSFYSSASQIAPDGTELADEETVVVWAEPTAYNFETTDDGPETIVYEEEEIPLVSEDGNVVGIGTADFVSDSYGGFEHGNEQFLLNLFDAKMGGEGTVLWDEGHDQYYELALEYYDSFRQYAADSGYDLRATTNVLGRAQLAFPSTASQVAPDGGALADPGHVVVWAEPTAGSVDDEGDEASHIYGDEEIPLVSRDGNVVGFGTPELIADDDLTDANEQFALNLLEDTIGGSATLLWDDAHGTYYDSSSFGDFATAVESEGYAFEATDGLLGGEGGGEISELEFFSTASLLDADGQPLTDDSLVAVWAESTAENADENDDGHVAYPDDVDIPLVAVDGSVVGVGCDLATDESEVDANRTFLVNAWEDRVGSAGTVLYDESHGQALSLSDYSQLQAAAEERGFAVEATNDLAADLGDADAVMVTTPDEAFSDDELDALASFVADGGAAFVHDQADFDGHSTDALDEIAAALGADFRFNSDQIVDEEHSGWAPFVVQTGNFNDDFDFFNTDGDGSTIEAADVVAIPSPSDPYTDAELAALDDHLADGGAVFLFDESEFTNEETANLNAVADHLDLGFRFNADQVEDPENNDGVDFVPTTANFNEGFDVFDGLETPGLDGAEGLVVASPTEAFSEEELSALDDFVADGGALFVLDESDFGGQGNDSTGFDETENLNAIADRLDLSFRFNSDQVNDGDEEFDITTANFNDRFDYFAEREDDIGIDFDPDEAYYGRVTEVVDGDTFVVEFDSEYDYTDVIRNLGPDTPETGSTPNASEEWFGIEDADHLDEWGQNALAFADDVMWGGEDGGDPEGRRIKVTFDDVEGIRGNYGRLLAYVHYDPDDFDAGPESGEFSVDYNRQLVEEGYARVYSSGFGRHDEFAAAEEAALAEGRGLWSAADFESLEEIRNDPVEEVFVPRASSVTSADGRIGDDRVPVYASPTAEQEAYDDGVDFDGYEEPPLVGVDRDNRVAVVGGLLFHEQYEAAEGFAEDTSGYGNFPLITNLARYLSNNDGDLLVEGGHAQFEVSGSVSLERVQYYLRFVEGVGSRLRQVNDVVNTLPDQDDPTALFVTAPGRAYTEAELAALRDYRDAGGAVVLVGSTDASAEHRANLDAVAAGLGSDLRLNDDRVVDPDANLADDPTIPATSAFDESFPLFSPIGEGPFDHLDPEQRAYLELIADENGRVTREAVDGAVEDWSAGRIDRETLDAAIRAWEQDLQVIVP